MNINIGSKNGFNNFGSTIGQQVGTPEGFNNFNCLIGEQVFQKKPKKPSWDSEEALKEVKAQIEAELARVRGAKK